MNQIQAPNLAKSITDFTLRYSTKAKYLQLRISPKGLEVVVPTKKKSPTLEQIHDFIAQKYAWIQKNTARIVDLAELKQPEHAILPTQIHLQALSQVWEVQYLATAQKKLTLMQNAAHQLTLLGPITRHQDCLLLLRQWLKKMAEEPLTNRLLQLSQKTGLSVKQVSIRNNKTRWGSCTTRNHISLCCKLLLIPLPLVDHVLLHELCHTEQMNHGRLFWKLLRRFDLQANEHAKQLKLILPTIPLWAVP